MLNFNVRNVFDQAIAIHNDIHERTRHKNRIFSSKISSCSWLGTLFCCTTMSKKSHEQRYTV